MTLSSFGSATKKRIQESLINMCDTKIIIKDNLGNILYDFYIVDALDVDGQIIHFDDKYISLIKLYIKSDSTLDSYLDLKHSNAKKLLMFMAKYNNKNMIIEKKLLYKILNEGNRIKDSDIEKYLSDLVNSKFVSLFEIHERYVKVTKS